MEDAIPLIIKISRLFAAQRKIVFAAWTTPQIMEKWFFPGGWIEGTTNELRFREDFSGEVIAGEARDPCDRLGSLKTDEEYYHYSEFLEVDKPNRIVFKWSSPLVSDSFVTVEFSESGEFTAVILTHELLGSEHVRAIHTAGWERCLSILAEYIHSVAIN